MLIHDTLDRIAESTIPEGVHPMLHVKSRTCWVESVQYMIEAGLVKPTKYNIAKLAQNWESVLYAKFSSLN